MTRVTVRDLDRALAAAFPHEWAEEWDRVGLLAGDPDAAVTGVLVALDPTREAVAHARRIGANVLITHHPAFLEPPCWLTPGRGAAGVLFDALSGGVALLAAHTNLDRAPAASGVLPALLGLTPLAPLERSPLPARLGAVSSTPAGTTLASLVRAAAQATGTTPRVWGDPSRALSRVATATGSAGSLIGDAIAAGAQALVAGEVRYHDALSAADAGLAIVELGHDVSEWPLVPLLADVVRAVPGIAPDSVTLADPRCGWWTPDKETE